MTSTLPGASPNAGADVRPARVVPETELSLLVDVGSAWTKAALVGRAGGRWRIVTGAAQPSGWGLGTLVEDLAARLTPHADPRLARRLPLLLREAPRITCRSPRRPGRLAIVSEAPDGVSAAARVAERSGWEVAVAVTTGPRAPVTDSYLALRDADPDAWLAIAGPGRPVAWGVGWGMMAAARGPSSSPVLLVAPEDDEVTGRFARLLGTGVQRIGAVVDEDLAAALIRLTAQACGVAESRHLAPLAFGRAMGALAGGLGLQVLGVDLGAVWLSWSLGQPPGSQQTAMLSGLPIPEARTAVESLPSDADPFAVGDAMANLAARRASLPGTVAEAVIAQAQAIDRLAAARRQMGSAPSVDLLVGSGRLLAGASHPADAALVLLDGLRPSGVTQLALDSWGICGPLGALADGDVSEGLETLRDDLLVPLGTALVTQGGRPGQPVLSARLHRPGWPDAPRQEIRSGTLTTLPLERGAAGELDIELERGVTLGSEHRGRRLRVAVTGGAVGVIFDARGDPMALPARPGDARAVVQTWRDGLRHEQRPSGS